MQRYRLAAPAALLVMLVTLTPVFAAPAHAQAGSATLVAVVTDTAGRPLADAAVWVGLRMSELTDERGRVTIHRIPAGEHLLRVRHDTHRTASVVLAIEEGATVEVEVELEPAMSAIELPGITVRAERRAPHLVRQGFYDRQAQGLGSFADRDRIERLGAAGDLCRVFDELRGFMASSPAGRCVVLSRRGVSLPAGGSGGSRLCSPTFMVDGAIWDRDMVASLSPVHVEAVEGYAGPGTTPGRFTRGMANFCGTIVIWLRW
jgi:hypothetical protein